ncbi:hypothetical protein Vspart_03044 [Vibrio spartinae]|uniref:DUF3265 domain-containing protein n=1 Tax=Vibrio spartinae TaxID=1918945 RepID=A0ABX6R326_9VIBR|nr:hypothetical protein Vspart_03044 [Vibrio spartinae]
MYARNLLTRVTSVRYLFNVTFIIAGFYSMLCMKVCFKL